MSEMTATFESLNVKTTELQTIVGAKNREIEALNSKINELNSTIEGPNRQIAQSQSTIESRNREIEALKGKIS